jgi:hypothetical protein
VREVAGSNPVVPTIVLSAVQPEGIFWKALRLH